MAGWLFDMRLSDPYHYYALRAIKWQEEEKGSRRSQVNMMILGNIRQKEKKDSMHSSSHLTFGSDQRTEENRKILDATQ